MDDRDENIRVDLYAIAQRRASKEGFEEWGRDYLRRVNYLVDDWTRRVASGELSRPNEDQIKGIEEYDTGFEGVKSGREKYGERSLENQMSVEEMLKGIGITPRDVKKLRKNIRKESLASRLFNKGWWSRNDKDEEDSNL